MTQPIKRARFRTSEKGAALITVLFLVTVMATISVALFDQVRFDILKAQGRQLTTQARWFALGSEQLAIKLLEDSEALSPNRTSLVDPWATQSGRFPIPGGYIDGTLSDAGNCFNINSLVEVDENGTLIPNEETAAQLQTLLLALELDETTAEEVAGRLTDWVDTDGSPSERGAEDFDYLALKPAYRTANTLMADPSELRAIKDMSIELHDSIRPYLCALPSTEPSIINVNTLAFEKVALLTMILGGSVEPDAAIAILEQRPPTGWGNIDNFLALPGIADLNLSADAAALLSVDTRYFTLNSVVVLDKAYVTVESLLDTEGGNGITLISRRFGEET